MYFGDHPPPHFHVITSDDCGAVYRIDTLQLWQGDDLRDAQEALEWAASNTSTLQAKWAEYSEEE
jgi:hypothetical protein